VIRFWALPHGLPGDGHPSNGKHHARHQRTNRTGSPRARPDLSGSLHHDDDPVLHVGVHDRLQRHPYPEVQGGVHAQLLRGDARAVRLLRGLLHRLAGLFPRLGHGGRPHRAHWLQERGRPGAPHLRGRQRPVLAGGGDRLIPALPRPQVPSDSTASYHDIDAEDYGFREKRRTSAWCAQWSKRGYWGRR